MWFLSHVTELGVALGYDAAGYVISLRVRTTFDNPDAVVTALEPLLHRAVRGDAAAVAAIRDLARRSPGTPLARDVARGPGAEMVAPVIVSVLARLLDGAGLRGLLPDPLGPP